MMVHTTDAMEDFMKVQLKAATAFSSSDEKLFERRVARLRRRLVREAGDHVALTVHTQDEPRTRRSVGSARLAIGEELLMAQRNVAESPSSLLTQMFDDLERQLSARSARRKARRRTVLAG
jgi:hypothetical protein